MEWRMIYELSRMINLWLRYNDFLKFNLHWLKLNYERNNLTEIILFLYGNYYNAGSFHYK